MCELNVLTTFPTGRSHGGYKSPTIRECVGSPAFVLRLPPRRHLEASVEDLWFDSDKHLFSCVATFAVLTSSSCGLCALCRFSCGKMVPAWRSTCCESIQSAKSVLFSVHNSFSFGRILNTPGWNAAPSHDRAFSLMPDGCSSRSLSYLSPDCPRTYWWWVLYFYMEQIFDSGLTEFGFLQ